MRNARSKVGHERIRIVIVDHDSRFMNAVQPTVLQSSALVPFRYRGVWQRTLLEAPGVHDVETTVFWLQTSSWHADIRVPTLRPGFSGVASLRDCNRAQLNWLAQQQGFAGLTTVDVATQPEICRWHRLLDFCPPASSPDAGYMMFEPDRLVETGVHGTYLEHWKLQPQSTEGFAVLKLDSMIDDEIAPARYLMIAGDHVMHVRARQIDWPHDIPLDFDMTQLGDGALRDMLDFEISFGTRTANGWQIRHSTLPWLENRRIQIALHRIADERVELAWDGVWSSWHVLEWQSQ